MQRRDKESKQTNSVTTCIDCSMYRGRMENENDDTVKGYRVVITLWLEVLESYENASYPDRSSIHFPILAIRPC